MFVFAIVSVPGGTWSDLLGNDIRFSVATRQHRVGLFAPRAGEAFGRGVHCQVRAEDDRIGFGADPVGGKVFSGQANWMGTSEVRTNLAKSLCMN